MLIECVTPPRKFPPAFRNLFCPFHQRWDAKRKDYDQFVALLDEVNSTKLSKFDARLPDGLIDDWQASWVSDLFPEILPGHDRSTQEQIVSAFEDVAALVKAFQFVEYPGRFNNTCRFWFYELSANPGMGLFPKLEQVIRHCPDLNPRRGMEHLAGDASNSSRYDQAQFFEAAAFLLGTPTDLEWDWLHRLAYRPCPLDSIWSDPPRHRTWTRNQLVRVIPPLGGCLDKYPPELDDSTLSITEVVRRTDKWICKVARPAIAALHAVADNFKAVAETLATPPAVTAGKPPAERDAPAGKSEQLPVVATPTPVPLTVEAIQPDPYAELRAFAEKKLIGKQSKIIKLLCDKEGRVSLTDLATIMGWPVTCDNDWNSAKTKLNDKLKKAKMCWKLSRLDSHAILEMLKSQSKPSVLK